MQRNRLLSGSMLLKHLEKTPGVLIILQALKGTTNTLIVRVFDCQKKPIPNVKVNVFKIEKNPITPEQWVENLKNGSPFKRLVFSINTDNKGAITAELPQGTYEAKVEKYGFNQTCDLTQNVEVLVVEPKKHWWY
jgi:hypothetical protein